MLAAGTEFNPCYGDREESHEIPESLSWSNNKLIEVEVEDRLRFFFF
jgi:hypothetical protein